MLFIRHSPSGAPDVPASRFALIILDGLADRPDPSGRAPTPLELARTPNLDRLAAEGRTGLVTVIGPGIAPESDAGVLSLLGYDPVHDSPGRGVLEALGAEVPLAPGDVAVRLNFATLDATGAVEDARVGRDLSTEGSQALAAEVNAADLLRDLDIHAEVRPTVGHRGVLWLHPLRGGALSGEVSNSDPFYERTGGMGHARTPADRHPREVRALASDPSAERTARAINAFLARVAPVLARAAVNRARSSAGKKVGNGLLLRNAGSLPDPPPERFEGRHGLAGAAVTEMPVERGIARLFGLEDRFVGPMGPDRDRSLAERAEATLKALATTPFCYVHLKGPDEPGHDGNAAKKQEIIEALDRSFFGPFLQGLPAGSVRIAITADHATPATMKGHSDDPVPLILWGPGISPERRPSPPKFSERGCETPGALRLTTAREVVPLLLGKRPLPDPPR
jgi:2,3-bisphosphoglycerate-independent phosphoglycerate mutase